MRLYVLIMVTISICAIVFVISMAEARGRGGGFVRHDGYNGNRNRSTLRLIPTVPLTQGNRISDYQGQRGWVRSFPTRTIIPRGGPNEQGREND